LRVGLVKGANILRFYFVVCCGSRQASGHVEVNQMKISKQFVTLAVCGCVGIMLLVAAALIWPGFLVPSRERVVTPDQPVSPPSVQSTIPEPVKKSMPGIGEFLVMARQEIEKRPKQPSAGNWGDQRLVNLVALQCLLALKSGEKQHLAEARKTANDCAYIGFKAEGFYLVAAAHARLGDVEQAKVTMSGAEALFASAKLQAFFQTYFALASGERDYFDRARQRLKSDVNSHSVFPEIVKLVGREAVRTRNARLLNEAWKIYYDIKPSFPVEPLGYLAMYQAQLGDKPAALATFAEAERLREPWNVVRILCETTTATGDRAYLERAETLAPNIKDQTKDETCIRLTYQAIAIAQARQGVAGGDDKCFTQARESAAKIPAEQVGSGSYSVWAVVNIAIAKADAAVATKNPRLIEEALQIVNELEGKKTVGKHDRAMAAIACAEFRLAAKTGDASLLRKGFKSAAYARGVADAEVAAALAESGYLADYEQLLQQNDAPGRRAETYRGLAEGLIRQKGWWSPDELFCQPLEKIWLFD